MCNLTTCNHNLLDHILAKYGHQKAIMVSSQKSTSDVCNTTLNLRNFQIKRCGLRKQTLATVNKSKKEKHFDKEHITNC